MYKKGKGIKEFLFNILKFFNIFKGKCKFLVKPNKQHVEQIIKFSKTTVRELSSDTYKNTWNR